MYIEPIYEKVLKADLEAQVFYSDQLIEKGENHNISHTNISIQVGSFNTLENIP
jgi:hypothetical protein